MSHHTPRFRVVNSVIESVEQLTQEIFMIDTSDILLIERCLANGFVSINLPTPPFFEL